MKRGICTWRVGPGGKFDEETLEQYSERKIREMQVSVLDEIPHGWKEIKNSPQRIGHKWISNGKSRFSGEYKHALLRI